MLGCNYNLIMSDIRLGSLNINGARGDAKRASLFTLLENKNLNVTFLQETKLKLKINAEFEKVKICFINSYAPCVGAERLLLFEKLKDTLSTCDSEEYLFLGGDFNCTENPVLDRNHQEPHAASKSALMRLTETFELCDVWRHFHPGQRQYTWVHSRDNMLSLARLDHVYVFSHHINVSRSCSISPVGISDHSLVQVSLFINHVKCNSAYWHFNASLLADNHLKNVLTFFWENYRLSKSEYNSLQQWWDIGKVKIKQLCQQYTFSVTKDMARSLRALEREVDCAAGIGRLHRRARTC